jgi:hypothetical protein
MIGMEMMETSVVTSSESRLLFVHLSLADTVSCATGVQKQIINQASSARGGRNMDVG